MARCSSAPPSRTSDSTSGRPTAGVRDLIEAACELVPHAWTAALKSARAGLRPGTPDGLPIIGRFGAAARPRCTPPATTATACCWRRSRADSWPTRCSRTGSIRCSSCRAGTVRVLRRNDGSPRRRLHLPPSASRLRPDAGCRRRCARIRASASGSSAHGADGRRGSRPPRPVAALAERAHGGAEGAAGSGTGLPSSGRRYRLRQPQPATRRAPNSGRTALEQVDAARRRLDEVRAQPPWRMSHAHHSRTVDAERWLQTVDGWTLDGDAIKKQFTFAGFPRRPSRSWTGWRRRPKPPTTIPTSSINYKRVTLTYSTHSEGGLTQKDFAGARDGRPNRRDRMTEAQADLQLARSGGADRPERAAAADLGCRRAAVTRRSRRTDRRRRLHRAPLHADRALRAARAGRSPAARVLGRPAARDRRTRSSSVFGVRLFEATGGGGACTS